MDQRIRLTIKMQKMYNNFELTKKTILNYYE